mmetsp:Transcript_783/g.1304  ORF Transcript_783/g.1304 Transcript_783/m.1304 type:complete len:210 (+) Transcript_783:47-676(+)|eukprot:CAMPEP_0169118564 /NCGR_PEP_ID=MMETSP1015-20121227/31065_1 /TAXON_ID=342587 /ORGANISM="Karlodinium micrum, Strain CCMP2283" /LENGTH=209 /DNA_ID=CAMNT_0009181335 /DNA_START=47 /DNA_END=676 /DNA_ORIENTATION=+
MTAAFEGAMRNAMEEFLQKVQRELDARERALDERERLLSEREAALDKQVRTTTIEPEAPVDKVDQEDKAKNIFTNTMPPSPSRGRTNIPVASPLQNGSSMSSRAGFQSSLAASPRISASPPLPVAAASPRRNPSIALRPSIAERQGKLFASLGFQNAHVSADESMVNSSVMNTSVVSSSGVPAGRRSLAELLKEDETKLTQGVAELRVA